MNENLNLVEILKDCPRGTKLYSTIFGEAIFDNVAIGKTHPIVIRLKDGSRKSFSAEGKLYIMYDGECTLFPSKNQRDWSKFNPKKEGFITPCEFKDGDIVATNSGLQVFILQRPKSNKEGYFYIGYDFGLNDIFHAGECKFNRLSTEEEKQKLFDAIKKRGYKWNAETKTLEKFVEPRFNVGDWVVFIKSKSVYRVEKKENYEYTLRYILGGSMCLPFSNEELIREWTIEDAKDGDVLACNEEILLFKSYSSLQGRISLYCWYNGNTNNFHSKEVIDILLTTRNKVCPATKEQRDAMMKAMNDACYKWNAETKTLDKLIKPKFKVGDEIVNSYMEYMGAPGTQRTILKITDDKYIFTDGSRMSISSQDSWDLLSDMLEPKTLDDDKIKTAIRNHLLEMWERCQKNVYGVHVADAITWLKKQGESDKNPNSKTIAEYLYKEKGYPISLNEEIPTFEVTMKDVRDYNAYKEKKLIEIACKWLREQKEMIGISFQEDFIERFKVEMNKYTN